MNTTQKPKMSEALREAQAKYRNGKRKLPGVLINEPRLATLQRIQTDNNIDTLAGAVWHAIDNHYSEK